jgi:hypothetical protein
MEVHDEAQGYVSLSVSKRSSLVSGRPERMPKTPPKKLVKRPVVIPQADNRTIASAGIPGAIRRTERFYEENSFL